MHLRGECHRRVVSSSSPLRLRGNEILSRGPVDGEPTAEMHAHLGAQFCSLSHGESPQVADLSLTHSNIIVQCNELAKKAANDGI